MVSEFLRVYAGVSIFVSTSWCVLGQAMHDDVCCVRHRNYQTLSNFFFHFSSVLRYT